MCGKNAFQSLTGYQCAHFSSYCLHRIFILPLLKTKNPYLSAASVRAKENLAGGGMGLSPLSVTLRKDPS